MLRGERKYSEAQLEIDGGPSLSYRLIGPATVDGITKLALLAHPLGRLGGSQDDHVIRSLANFLSNAGWTVCTYDARGAGNSTGSPSFSGAPEASDYQAILHQVLLPLLAPSTSPDAPHPALLLAGYSFGSLAASSCPPPASHPTLRTRHLLLSYPLSVLWALTLFRSSPFDTAIRDLVSKDERADVLAVFGDTDQFTAVGKYRVWKDGLEALGDGGGGEGAGERRCGRFRGVEVEGADHFWTARAKARLLEEVGKWLEE